MPIAPTWRGAHVRRIMVVALATALVGAGVAAAKYGLPSPDGGRTVAPPHADDDRPVSDDGPVSVEADPPPFTEVEAAAVAERLSQGPAHHVRVPDILAELGGDSFAGLRMEDGGQHIVSYWAGDVPVDAERYAASEPDGVTIALRPAEFSREQLSAAAERVLNSPLTEHAAISLVSPKYDGSGLEIAVEDAEPDKALKAELAAVAGLADDAIFYTPNTGPIVRLPATAGPGESGG